MKHRLTSLIIAISPTILISQILVSTQPQQRIALVEQFTGVNCGLCPPDNNAAATLVNEPIVVGIHAGPLAAPQSGQPDFVTAGGTDLYNFFGPTTLQTATVGRSAYAGSIMLGRGDWQSAVNTVQAQTSPVNIGLESTFNSASRLLTVDVEIYYTGNSPAGNDFIEVYLTENDISGFQSDFANGPQPNYLHQNVLREVLTPTWGDEVLIGTTGHTETRQYVYSVPLGFNIGNCEVTAFIGEFQSEVYQARRVKADGGTTLVYGDLISSSPADHAGGTSGGTTQFTGTFTNMLATPEDFLFSLSATNAPVDWTASFSVSSMTYTTSQTISLINGLSNPITVDVTPGPTAGLAEYVLTVSSISNPTADSLQLKFNVISGVTDLIMDNPGAEAYGALYMDGLILAGEAGRARTSMATAMDYAVDNALTGLQNMYLNISNTMPTFSDATIIELKALMDGGVNLFIAGQDIGWDIMSGAPNSSGTPSGQDFYENYMLAGYLDDGSPSTDTLVFSLTDGVYGWTPGSSINNIFGSNTYPEEILPTPPLSSSIMTYGDPFKIGGVRGETTDFKVVYLGIGLEQFSSQSVAAEVVKRAHDWFYGAVGTADFDVDVAELMRKPYPVPSNEQLTIPLNVQDGSSFVRIVDIAGKVVIEERIPAEQSMITLNTRNLPSGYYSYQLLLDTGIVSGSGKFEVAR